MQKIFTFTLFTWLLIPTVDAKNPTAITLSPHLTELVYSAGGASQLIGVSAYSNYPLSATEKTVIGDAFRLDLEVIHQLRPDLIFYWVDGTSKQTLEQLKTLDSQLIPIETQTLTDIPKAIHQIAHLLNTQPDAAVGSFSEQLAALEQPQKHTALLQISDQPIYTVDATHWMSEAMATCGLKNVFRSLPTASATVTLESVVAHNPGVLVRISPHTENNPLHRWPKLDAIAHERIAVVEADHMTRPTMRILLAIKSLCDQVNQW